MTARVVAGSPRQSLGAATRRHLRCVACEQQPTPYELYRHGQWLAYCRPCASQITRAGDYTAERRLYPDGHRGPIHVRDPVS
jgi:hypothetical protein